MSARAAVGWKKAEERTMCLRLAADLGPDGRISIISPPPPASRRCCRNLSRPLMTETCRQLPCSIPAPSAQPLEAPAPPLPYPRSARTPLSLVVHPSSEAMLWFGRILANRLAMYTVSHGGGTAGAGPAFAWVWTASQAAAGQRSADRSPVRAT